jgi:hypothetical protein
VFFPLGCLATERSEQWLEDDGEVICCLVKKKVILSLFKKLHYIILFPSNLLGNSAIQET